MTCHTTVLILLRQHILVNKINVQKEQFQPYFMPPSESVFNSSSQNFKVFKL